MPSPDQSARTSETLSRARTRLDDLRATIGSLEARGLDTRRSRASLAVFERLLAAVEAEATPRA